jgi:glycoprotein-N-acetylgalactosamine 3-beta-galactosyltransferase
MVCLLLIWVGVAVYFTQQSNNLERANASGGIHNTQQERPPVLSADDKKNPNNPWDGWQPTPIADADKSTCSSWRRCFQDSHRCPGLCRDDDDMGEAPAVSDDWVPDVTMLRRMMLRGYDGNGDPWPPPLVTDSNKELCEPMNPFGQSNGDTNKDLLDAVPIRGSPLVSPTEHLQNGYAPRILCMVYTMEGAHANRIRAIRETWAGGCDGFLAFSTKSDPRIPAVSLPHDGPEEYNNMWQKVRSIWSYVGNHFLDDFDFFFQGGDDLYVLPQNLRNYLKNAVADPEQDFFGGRRCDSNCLQRRVLFLSLSSLTSNALIWCSYSFRQTKNVYFNSGGAGYVLSRGTLRKYVTQGINHELCTPHKHTAQEDVEIAQCLRKVFNVGLIDTRDEQGRERFHPFAPGTHYTWKPPKPPERDWYEDYNVEWPVKLGKDCCAPDSVSFHYVKKPAMVRHLHSLLYHCDD